MATDHGLGDIVATNIEDWYYDIPDGYFDNIEGTPHFWTFCFLALQIFFFAIF